ncbi:hypothetical protein HG535_0F05890 [Zygotorulaspora mrakii]|uniref:F-box domain-containing protein n=1 Tax=Zygotorulaspora mrakii TaxID=42260 RepID=A0A7H9B684_ZYGMR|nr:uncharacterized protein HG535_0F05890 [Zygotorulaspora mrakii]QLG74077.1 hypothetical protein HG535_0F05890 [Zygotorulaspora mrakii]
MNGTDDVVEKALDLGTAYFKGEDFVKAKDIFKKALQLVRSYDEQELGRIRERYGAKEVTTARESPSSCKVYHPRYVRILDNLSATYEKLGELETALKYAQKMTDVEPYNLKCFIRGGKILQKLRRDRSALKLYDKAIKMTKQTDRQFVVGPQSRWLTIIDQQKRYVSNRIKTQSLNCKQLMPVSDLSSKRTYLDPIAKEQRLFKKTKDSKCQATSPQVVAVDFIRQLPLEVIPFILKRFTSKELLQLVPVCKTWKNIILKLPEIFRSFVLHRASPKDIGNFCDFLRTVSSQYSNPLQGFPVESIHFSVKAPSDEIKTLDLLFLRLQDVCFRKMILTVPNCSTSHFAKITSKDRDLTKRMNELSVVLSLRQDKHHENKILKNFPNLKRIEIIFESSVVPITELSSVSQEVNVDAGCMNAIESFKLICNYGKIKTFPFLDLFKSGVSKNLSSLCITGVTFTRGTTQFDWLRNFKSLKDIWIEGNKNATFSSFMKLFRDYSLSTHLTTLTFREDSISARFDLEEVSDDYFYGNNLKNLSSLDVMGTSLSGLGLMRIAAYMNDANLKRINFGDCPFLKLQREGGDDDFALTANHFFSALQNIEDLSIPQLGTLSDQDMAILRKEIGNMKSLKRMDLSLNQSITGVSVYDLLKALKESSLKPLEYLNIDGCTSVSHITINALKAQGLVQQVSSIYEKVKWRKFGLNSYKYQK